MSRNFDAVEHASRAALQAGCAQPRTAQAGDIDLALLEDSLSKTPWERMLANDDALNFADSLRTAMDNRHAKP